MSPGESWFRKYFSSKYNYIKQSGMRAEKVNRVKNKHLKKEAQKLEEERRVKVKEDRNKYNKYSNGNYVIRKKIAQETTNTNTDNIEVIAEECVLGMSSLNKTIALAEGDFLLELSRYLIFGAVIDIIILYKLNWH